MRKLVLIVGAVLTALPILAAGAALPADDAVIKGSAFIYSTLEATGAYGTDSPGQNMDAILAVRASGYDPAKDVLPGGSSPADYLEVNAAAIPNAAAAGKAALAAEALGLDPEDVAGTDLIAKIVASYDSAIGRYAGDDFGHSLAILGLACTANSVEAGAVTALREAQLDDGGWGFGGSSDPDTTAITVQALTAAGIHASDPDVATALAHLKSTQAADGGWGFDPAASNTSSTAFVVQALLALGEDPEGATYAKGSNTPVSFLLSQQLADGSFEGFDPLFAANQVVPALAGRTFCNMSETPITRVRQQTTPTATATPPPVTAAPTPPTVTPAAPATVAPAPPTTGTGGASSASPLTPLGVIAGVLLMALGAAAFAVRRPQWRRG